MHGRRLRHIAGVLAVTVASGLLFSVSALNERKNPAATSDLSTLVRNRQEQVKVVENEVAALDGDLWSTWCDGGAAERFADLVRSVAR